MDTALYVLTDGHEDFGAPLQMNTIEAEDADRRAAAASGGNLRWVPAALRCATLTAALCAMLLPLAACGGDGTGPTPDPSVSGIAKVSGDGQRAAVRPADAAPSLSVAAVVSNDPTLLPELLVARIEFAAPSLSASFSRSSASGSAPAFQTAPVPPGTVVNWEVGIAGVPGPDSRCGSPRVGATQADDSAYVANGWRRGTLADTTCVARTALYNRTELVEADSFTARFTPGAVAVGRRFDAFAPNAPRVLLLDRRSVQDVHGNAIPFRIQVAAGDTLVSAGGDVWGTVESRTLLWADVSGAAELPTGVFHLVDEAGARIARVHYTLYTNGAGIMYASFMGVADD